MSRQTQVWCIAATIVMSAPLQARAQEDFAREFFAQAGDCNVVVECAVEARNVIYEPGGEETTSMATLHTHISFANMDRKCPTSGQLHFEFAANFCYRDTGSYMGNASPIQGEVTAEITPGFASYELPLTHSFSQDYLCNMRSPLVLVLDNGERRRVECMQTAAVGINKAGVDVQQPFLQRPQPYGNPYLVTQRYEVNLEPESAYTLTFPSFRERNAYSGALLTSWRLDNSNPCLTEPLDELVACSSDQTPVCGCDGRVWEGPCEATRAGVVIRSASANHPSCQPTLHREDVAPRVSRATPAFEYKNHDSQDLCQQESNNPAPYTGMLVDGVISDGARIRARGLEPHHIIPWSARFEHGRGHVTHTSGVLLQDIDEIPTTCDEQDYRLRACSTLDPCCGRLQGTCVTEAERAAWCARLGDTDCDGLPDDQEVASDPGLIDTDGDGLPDGEELALGTVPSNADTDGDGLSDGEEWRGGLDPRLSDTDGDGLPDGEDPLPRLDDHDRDGAPNLDDPFPDMPDGDLDGIPDGMDEAPENPDRDSDGVVDGAEVLLGTDPNDASDPTQREMDADGDGLPDVYEMTVSFSDPNSADTDGDRLSDLMEVMWGCSPVEPDTDGDGLSDFEELHEHFTEPTNMDSDGDGLSDALEVMQSGSSPWLVDTDGDGLSDALEVMHLGTRPTSRDSDGGGVDDMDEWVGSGDYRDAGDDSAQIMERHVEMPEGLTARFFRDPLGPRLDLTPQFLDQEEEAPEILSARLVDMPYHQMAYQFRIRARDLELFWFGSLVRFDVHMEGFEFEEVSSYHTEQGMGHGPSAIMTWSESESQRKLRLITHGQIMYTDGRTAKTRPASPDEEPPVLLLDEDTGKPELHMNLYKEDFSPEDDIITVILSMKAELIQTSEPEQCGNGLDDDFDGAVDCLDEDCAEACAPLFEICGNGLDDDMNGVADCMDLACVDACVDFEVCDDRIDNDGDGLVDLGDPYCEGYCDDFGCGPEQLVEVCGDGYDNDFNGLIDGQDPACQLENCEDGVDNDGDGYTDCLDEKCAMDFFCCNLDDTCGGELCNDGFDNDFDGLIDCEDDECGGTTACIIPGVPPRRSLRDRISDGCGCTSVTGIPAEDSWPRELLVVGLIGGLWIGRRKRQRSC